MYLASEENELLKRFTLSKKLEYYIEESIYYRTHSESINPDTRTVLWDYKEENGRSKIK
jgi:hypothetical protein